MGDGKNRIRGALVKTCCLMLLVAVVFSAAPSHAQETVFNVPSPDVLDKGKIYGEVDMPTAFQQSTSSFQPRVVAGLGKRVEAGLNFIGLSAPDTGQLSLSPTIKWVPYKGSSGWSLFFGDNVFFPVRQRQYLTIAISVNRRQWWPELPAASLLSFPTSESSNRARRLRTSPALGT